MDSLGQIDGPRAVAVLASFVESPDLDLARAALKSLGQIDHPDALPPLLEALRSPDAAARIEALQALGARGAEEAVKAMQWTAAADPDARVAQAAIDALARAGDARSHCRAHRPDGGAARQGSRASTRSRNWASKRSN